MNARLVADTLLVLHFLFIAVVVAGGLLALRWPRVAWAHLPCAAWGAWIELSGWICPLTPLENAFRRQAGEAGYPGGFIEHYVVELVYPAGLTRGIQLALALLVVVLNVAVYATLVRRVRRAGSEASGSSAR